MPRLTNLMSAAATRWDSMAVCMLAVCVAMAACRKSIGTSFRLLGVTALVVPSAYYMGTPTVHRWTMPRSILPRTHGSKRVPPGGGDRGMKYLHSGDGAGASGRSDRSRGRIRACLVPDRGNLGVEGSLHRHLRVGDRLKGPGGQGCGARRRSASQSKRVQPVFFRCSFL